jgi:hypothetical protein
MAFVLRRITGIVLTSLLSAGCAWGPERGHFVDGMAPYRDLPVQAQLPQGKQSLPPEQAESFREQAQKGLAGWSAVPPAASGALTALRVVPELLDFHVATPRDALDTFMRGQDSTELHLRLALECPREEEFTVRVPTDRTTWLGTRKMAKEQHTRTVFHECGEVFWTVDARNVSNQSLLDQAAFQSAAELAKRMTRRRDQWVNRSAGDERFILSSSALTLEPGEIVLADDELLLLRFGVGLSRRVELDAGLGGFVVPAAGAVPIPPLGIAGAAGGAVLAAFDLGVKVRLVDEDSRWPGIAASYDLLDLFGGALGGAAFVGYGIAAGAAAGVLNVQLNLLQLDVNKHFGDQLQVGGSLVLVDNHHILPQGVAFALAAATLMGGGVTGGASTIDRIPDALFPVFNVEWAFWPWFRVMQELSPGFQWNKRFGATGVRLVLSPDEDGRWIAWSHVRVKVDLAILEAHGGAQWDAIPWLGVGLYYF